VFDLQSSDCDLWSSDRYFDAEFAVVAEADVWRMGVFGEENGYLADIYVKYRRGRIAIEDYVALFIIFVTGIVETVDSGPPYRFTAFEGHMDVEYSGGGPRRSPCPGERTST